MELDDSEAQVSTLLSLSMDDSEAKVSRDTAKPRLETMDDSEAQVSRDTAKPRLETVVLYNQIMNED